MWSLLYWILVTLAVVGLAFVNFMHGNYLVAACCAIAAVIYILILVASIRKPRS
jgi:hypothetical protein